MRKPLPPMVFAVCLGAQLALRRVWPGPILFAASYTAVGLLPTAAGLMLARAGMRAFRATGTSPKPFAKPSRLATAGVYRWTRNPMYLGLALVLIGVWLALGTSSSALPVLAWWLIIDRAYIRAEEAVLMRTFGEEYQAYCASTRRWL